MGGPWWLGPTRRLGTPRHPRVHGSGDHRVVLLPLDLFVGVVDSAMVVDDDDDDDEGRGTNDNACGVLDRMHRRLLLLSCF